MTVPPKRLLAAFVALLLSTCVSSSRRDCRVDHPYFAQFEYSCREITVLTPKERLATDEWDGNQPVEQTFIRDVGSRFLASTELSDQPGPAAYLPTWAGSTPILTSPDLEPPRLEILNPDSLHPSFRVVNRSPELLVYFEFDNSPSFNSPSVFRVPSLVPNRADAEDLRSTAGVSLRLFVANHRDTEVPETLRAPFSLAVMFNQRERDTTRFMDLAQVAQLLALGVSDQRSLIEETYRYVTHTFLWGADTYHRTPLEVFSGGIAECGSVNNLLGTLLEINGVRYRAITGFNPIVRTFYPGGGHTAIEIQVDGRWHYVDSYLGILGFDVAGSELAASKLRDVPIFAILPNDLEELRDAGFGDQVTLGELFRYRIYYDFAMRNVPRTMIQLKGREARYGSDWPLRELEEGERLVPERDLPERVTVHVRARFIATDTTVDFGTLARGDAEAVASEWSYYEFDLDRDLLKEAASS